MATTLPPSSRRNQDLEGELPLGDDFFQKVVDSLETYAIFTTNLRGDVTSWNDGAKRVLGYSKKEIIGQNAAIFYTPEDIQNNQPQKEFKAAAHQGIALDERWHVRKNSKRFWGSGRVFPLTHESGKILGYTKIMRDLTARKVAQTRIAHSERRYKTLLEQTPAFIAILTGRKHVFEYVNPQYRQLVGFRDLIGITVADALPEIKGQGFIKILNRVYRTGEEFVGTEMLVNIQRTPRSTLEQRYVNFVYRPICDENDQISGIFAHGVDVTEQVLARQKVSDSEAALKLSEERLRTAINAGEIGVWDWDLVTNELSWTDRVYYILGVSPKTFKLTIGNYRKMIHPEDAQHVADLVQKSLKRGDAYNATFRVITPTGELRWVTTSGQPIYDKKGKPARLIGATTDITAQKKLEQDKNDFVSIATHELKTPVTSLKAYAQALQRRFSKSGDLEAANSLGKMDTQLNKLTTLISDMLDTTKIEAGKLYMHDESFDFDLLVHEVVEEMERTTPNHKLIIKGRSKHQITADRERVGQVIINLISNAIKYSPHSDQVLIKLGYDTKNVKACVQDYGVGIPKEKQTKIFERFYRVSGPKENTFPGLGLGLYISAEIIKRHGGRIWVDSTPDQGSVFCITLPHRRAK